MLAQVDTKDRCQCFPLKCITVCAIGSQLSSSSCCTLNLSTSCGNSTSRVGYSMTVRCSSCDPRLLLVSTLSYVTALTCSTPWQIQQGS